MIDDVEHVLLTTRKWIELSEARGEPAEMAAGMADELEELLLGLKDELADLPAH